VFIDETWVKTNMAPLRGWCTRGKRLIGKAPHGRELSPILGDGLMDQAAAVWA